jgi:ADP-heptose:LPS heptosyltransferase
LSATSNFPVDGIPRQGIHRILVCRPNHRLGNMLLMTPLIAELERVYKGAEIDLVAEGTLAKDVFATFFSVRNVYCLPRRGFKHPASFLALIARIRKNRYDLVIDPCVGSGFSRALARIFRGRYKLGFGDAQRTSRGLTHVVPTTLAPRHMAQRPVALVREYDVTAPDKGAAFPPMDIRLTEEERTSGKAVVRQLLKDASSTRAGLTIGIFADATGNKCYAAAWWQAFLTTLLVLAPQCRFVEIVPMHGRSMLDARWPSYYSSHIRRMAAVMSAMDLVISADCGVMHLAAASQVPTLGMFCVTDEKVYGPYGTRSGSLLTRDLSAEDAARSAVKAFPDLFGTPPKEPAVVRMVRQP